MNRRPWSRDELLVAFRLYCGTPFGKLHQHNPEIIETARLLGRTPSAVGMKAINFASLDPVQQARNITALGSTSRADRALWDEFTTNAESLAAEAEATWESLAVGAGLRAGPNAEEATRTLPASGSLDPLTLPAGPTETEHPVRRVPERMRRGQRSRAASSGSSARPSSAATATAAPCPASRSRSCSTVGDGLRAGPQSDILPWSENDPRRADPRNGLALHALYERAFDRGYITFDENLRVILSPLLQIENPPPLHTATLLSLEGQPLTLPDRFPPDREALGWHREVVFRG